MSQAIRLTPLLLLLCPRPIWHPVASPVHHDKHLSGLSPSHPHPVPTSPLLSGTHKLLHPSLVGLPTLSMAKSYLEHRRRLRIGMVNELLLSPNMQKGHMRSPMIRRVVRRNVNSNMKVSWRLNLCMVMVRTVTMEVCQILFIEMLESNEQRLRQDRDLKSALRHSKRHSGKRESISLISVYRSAPSNFAFDEI